MDEDDRICFRSMTCSFRLSRRKQGGSNSYRHHCPTRFRDGGRRQLSACTSIRVSRASLLSLMGILTMLAGLGAVHSLC